MSKTKPKEAVIEAYKAGQRVFGENYIQVMMILMKIVLSFHLAGNDMTKCMIWSYKSFLFWLQQLLIDNSWLQMRLIIIALIIYKSGVGGEVTGLRVASSVPGYPVALHWQLSDQQGGSHLKESKSSWNDMKIYPRQYFFDQVKDLVKAHKLTIVETITSTKVNPTFNFPSMRDKTHHSWQ